VKVLVTGGRGFLGSHVVERLRARGDDVSIASRRDYDLTHWDDALRLFADTEPELVIHLAAEVGGIGANRANPGRYWYANLMMGAHVLELARKTGVTKTVIAGTVCAYPKFTPTPFSEDDLWNGYPEETNAPYGVAKKSILVGAQSYRAQYGIDAVFLLPANLYGPRDNFDLETSHVIPALGRRLANTRVPIRRRCGGSVRPRSRQLLRRRTAQHRHRRGDLDPRARRDDRRAHRIRRGDRLGHEHAERPAATPARHIARGASPRLPREDITARRPGEDDRVVSRRGGCRCRPLTPRPSKSGVWSGASRVFARSTSWRRSACSRS
jgi:nucleoside-diphosphate-sugar epimerase